MATTPGGSLDLLRSAHGHVTSQTSRDIEMAQNLSTATRVIQRPSPLRLKGITEPVANSLAEATVNSGAAAVKETGMLTTGSLPSSWGVRPHRRSTW